jgi:hydroxyisourate hydrolase
MGKPASHVYLELWKFNETNHLVKILERRTNLDGRVDKPLLEGEQMQAGIYQLQFHIGDYFKTIDPNKEQSFLNVIPIQFEIAHENEHYHVPLLIAPGGYSTYRGS